MQIFYRPSWQQQHCNTAGANCNSSEGFCHHSSKVSDTRAVCCMCANNCVNRNLLRLFQFAVSNRGCLRANSQVKKGQEGKEDRQREDRDLEKQRRMNQVDQKLGWGALDDYHISGASSVPW